MSDKELEGELRQEIAAGHSLFDDIVARLRKPCGVPPHVQRKAADEIEQLRAEVERLRELPYEVALTKSVRGFSEPDPLPPCPVCGSKLMANEQQYARCERLATCGFALRRDAVSELCRLVEAGRATQG